MNVYCGKFECFHARENGCPAFASVARVEASSPHGNRPFLVGMARPCGECVGALKRSVRALFTALRAILQPVQPASAHHQKVRKFDTRRAGYTRSLGKKFTIKPFKINNLKTYVMPT